MISLSALRRALGLTTEDDALDLESIKSSIVEAWEELTKRKWDRRVDYVETFRQASDRVATLWPSLLPIESISKVEVRTYETSTDWETLDASEYEIVGEAEKVQGIRRVTRPWPVFARVTFTGGYTATPSVGQFKTPFLVAEAMLIQARFIRQRTSGENLIVTQRAVGKASSTLEEATFHPYFAKVACDKRRKV